MSEPLGLTSEQRAYSDAAELVDRETPPWWSPEFRESVIDMRICNQVRAVAALSEEYETADDERRREVYNRLLEVGAGMGSDGIWRARDPEWMRTA